MGFLPRDRPAFESRSFSTELLRSRLAPHSDHQDLDTLGSKSLAMRTMAGVYQMA